MKPLPKDHPMFNEGPSLVGLRRSNPSISANEPSSIEGSDPMGNLSSAMEAVLLSKPESKEPTIPSPKEPWLDLTELPKIPEFRPRMLGETPRAYAQARSEAAQKFAKEAIAKRDEKRKAEQPSE